MSTYDNLLAVAHVLAAFTRPWFISGGWAIDLFVGAMTRPHEDIEIGLWRADQDVLRDYLAGWELRKAIRGPQGGAYVPWEPAERLELPVHQVLARRGNATSAEMEFFLNEVEDGQWRFRRNLAFTRPTDTIVVQGRAGLPYLAPEIQLLYKARWHRPKDEHDFAQAQFSTVQRTWLRAALQANHPDDPWLAALASGRAER